jgi:hypothetical protein
MKRIALYIILLLALPIMLTAQSISGNYVPASDSKSSANSGIELRQISPTPLNPTSIVKFTLPKDSKVYIKICDAENKEIITLLNDVVSAGYHSVQFYVPGISGGTYYYSFTAESGGRKTVIREQMIL